MKAPNSKELRLHKPEILSDNPNLEIAVKVALVATAAAGVYHHFSKNGKGYTYLRQAKDGNFDLEIGITDFVSGRLERVRRLFGQITLPDDGSKEISEGTLSKLENPENLSGDDVASAFAPDIENNNPLQTGEDSL
jgi:hypothetical protein